MTEPDTVCPVCKGEGEVPLGPTFFEAGMPMTFMQKCPANCDNGRVPAKGESDG